jgi:phosphoesterase RecJ-like protein
MKKQMEINQMASLLKSHNKKFILLAHLGPDGDALGCLLSMGEALEKLGKEVEYRMKEPPNEYYMFMPGSEKIKYTVPEIASDDLIVSFDSSNTDIVSYPVGMKLDACTYVNIDHHFSNEYQADYNLVDVNCSSCSMICYKIIKAMGVKITPSMATNMYTGIVFDTGRFAYSQDPELFRIAGDLMAYGADHWAVFHGLYRHNTLEQFKTNAFLIDKAEHHFDKQLVFLQIPKEISEDINMEETESLVNQLSNIKDLEIMALIKYMEPNLTKVSLRSRGNFSVCDLAVELGGGGHLKAAGAMVELPFEETRDLLFKKIEMILKGEKAA